MGDIARHKSGSAAPALTGSVSRMTGKEPVVRIFGEAGSVGDRRTDEINGVYQFETARYYPGCKDRAVARYFW